MTSLSELIAAAFLQVVTLDNGHYIKHCRAAQEGCPARVRHYADLVVEASEATGVDPWLIAAKMVLSSGLDPNRVHPKTGAFGLISIHPRDPLARLCGAQDAGVLPVPYQCRNRLSSEQTVLRYAAAIAAYSTSCGSLGSGMLRWSTGECGGPNHPLWAKKAILPQRVAERMRDDK